MSDGIRAGFRSPLVTGAAIPDGTVTTGKIADGAITTVKIANLAVTNAKIDSLSASKITAGTINTGTITVGSELRMASGARIQFTRNSSAVISTNHSPQNGDVWIEYRGNNAGAIIGQWRSGGVDLVTAQLNVGSDGFEVTTGQFLIGTPGGGSASVPGLAFHNDSDTGLFRTSTNSLGFATAGSERWAITSGGRLDWKGSHGSATQVLLFGQSYTVYSDSTGPGSANTRLWFNSNHGGAMYFGPRSGSSYLAYVAHRANQYQQLSSGGVVADLQNNAVTFPGANTTTNSGLAAWRNNGFPGTHLLALSSTEKVKAGIRDLTPRRARQILGSYRPREWKSLAPADPKNVWMAGFVMEESPKTPKDLIAPLLVVVEELQSRVEELEKAAA